MRRATILAAVLGLAAIANAQTPTGPFTGNSSEGFESSTPGMFSQCVVPDIFGGQASLCTPGSSGAHVTSGWGFNCTIFPHGGTYFFGSAGGFAEYTFNSPVSRFGGYFGTNAGGTNATINIHEFGTDALLGSVVATITPNCAWTWNGWTSNSTAGIGRIEVIGNAFGGAFIDMDDMEADFGPGGGPGTVYCDCTSSGPCGNHGSAGNGCGNSANSAGAHLDGSGSANTGNDTLVLSATGMVPNQNMVFFQGDIPLTGSPFGDGLRCAGTNVVRLIPPSQADGAGNRNTSGVQISTVGGVSPGDTKYYQGWYRDPQGPCGNGFNLTNGYAVNWL